MSMSAPVSTFSFTDALFLAMIFGGMRRRMICRVAAIMSRVERLCSKPMAIA
jgi:hypothetical protein